MAKKRETAECQRCAGLYYPSTNEMCDDQECFNENMDPGYLMDETAECARGISPSVVISEELNAAAAPKIVVGHKDTNPKDAVGVKKWRQFCTVPFTVIWEVGVAMLEGARKYGRHNYRVAGVRGSVYIDAAFGHLTQWWEGEDCDPDTGLSHITKAIASLVVMRDAMIQGKFLDDRPPKTDLNAVRENLQARVDEIFERIPEAKEAFLEGDQHEGK